jgi:hypothetical protein
MGVTPIGWNSITTIVVLAMRDCSVWLWRRSASLRPHVDSAGSVFEAPVRFSLNSRSEWSVET